MAWVPKLSSFYITILVSTLIAVGIIGWRVRPVFMGTARENDDRSKGLKRWNRYLITMLRKQLGEELLVARAVEFHSERDNQDHSIATWSLVATLIPNVEYIALAPPDEDGRPQVSAIAKATDLRELLEGSVQQSDMWGHLVWIYSWPDQISYDAVVKRLPSVKAFRKQHKITSEGLGT